MRYLADTNICIWYAQERENLSRDVLAILTDYDNDIYVSSETLKELVLLWNRKPHIKKWWKTPLDLVRAVEDVWGWHVLYLHKEHYETYARLRINEAQDHRDPSDHLIISHAITNRIPLISSDSKFHFYTNQGLELIYNQRP